MKTEAEIEKVLYNIDVNSPSKYSGMTYEQGIEEALLWVSGDLSDEEFEFTE